MIEEMTTRQAYEYCGYVTPAGLYAAYRRGEVSPHGTMNKSFLWKRSELDRFLIEGKKGNTRGKLRLSTQVDLSEKMKEVSGHE